MGAPAVVMNDRVMGQCPNHLIPNPATGAPQPAPPMPFSAPLLLGLCTTVLIKSKPAAVVQSSGLNTPPHVGLHPSDPFTVPAQQQARIVSGSTTVLIGGRPAANAQSQCTCCTVPGRITPTVQDVLIG
ncbi:MAG TPA: PAAR domain-containing protein [Candidatus Dormibacteraeota bacterium]|jgi:uncharacterized Zn-binding protein involved in type VI secretion